MVQNLNYGGMERVMGDLIRHGDPARFEYHVLTLQYAGRFSREMEGLARLHPGVRQRRGSLLRPAALAEQLRGLAPDVVHTHSGVWYKASQAARLAGVKRVVHTEHGRRAPDPPLDRWIDFLASRRTDRVVAVSAALARHLRARVLARGVRLSVIPNGVDLAAFRPRPDDGVLRRELGLDPGTPVLGSIGRLEPIKGYDLMLAAFARLHGIPGPAPALVIAGDGSQRESLRRLAATLGIQRRVHFLGWRDDVQSLHRAFTLFTLSSRSEGTSVSLLEAMASGLPPVVTDVGGNAAVLGAGLARCLTPAGDAAALAGAWGALLADPGQADARGTDARRRVASAFGVRTMVDAYHALYAPSRDGARRRAGALEAVP